MHIVNSALVPLLVLLLLAAPAGATDYGNAPLVVPAMFGGFLIGLSLVFGYWAREEKKGSASGAGYWLLCGGAGLFGALLALPAGFGLVFSNKNLQDALIMSAVGLIALVLGFASAMIVAGGLKALRWILRVATSPFNGSQD